MKQQLYKPVLASEWTLLFKPEKTGCYVNDHTLIRHTDGSWHLIGITGPTPHINPEQERYFTHGFGQTLELPFESEAKKIDHGTRAWAPGAIFHKNRYYMYYGPSPTKMAVSPDLQHWINHEVQLIGHPIDSCHRDHMILQINAYTWAMYVTGIDAEGWLHIGFGIERSDQLEIRPVCVDNIRHYCAKARLGSDRITVRRSLRRLLLFIPYLYGLQHGYVQPNARLSLSKSL